VLFRRKLTPVNQIILAPQRRHDGGASGNAGLVLGAWNGPTSNF
jgi:hypothetical protein